MKKIILGIALSLIGFFAQAQNGLEQLIIEKYYVADAADAAGSVGTLPIGSVTYRIYADMLPGYKFQMAYGSSTHTLKLLTSTSFFNNQDRGVTTPTYTKVQAASNTVMLDSWLSVGAGCASNFGVLKSEDDGVNTVVNANGILANTDPSIGIPLTIQDGLIVGSPQTVQFVGIGPELSVFGSQSQVGNSFVITNGAWSALSGAVGPTTSNRILIAQITTDGAFHYEMNIQVGTPSGDIQKYVARNPLAGEILIPSLMGTYGGVDPAVYTMTGGGSYCQGSGGSAIGLSNSQLGINYTLIKNGTPTTVVIAGTGSAISFGNQLAGTYSASAYADGTVPTINSVLMPMTGSVVNTEILRETPAFTALGPYCQGTTPGTLPLTSLNSITGTWAPSTINTTTIGTMVYTFTPTAGLCANTVTMSVVVNPRLTPTFAALGPYCQGATPGTLLPTSINGIAGAWAPSTISTSSAGTTVYTFTPNQDQCANTTTMSIIVNVNVTPTFNSFGAYCQGETPGTLLLSSINGISGTWDPPTVSTVTAGTTVYTFTPNAGQCATTATMSVLVFEKVTPTFTTLGPYSIGETPDALPSTSINGIKGTWNPETINTAVTGSTDYTFTPDAGECASTVTMTVTVNAVSSKILNLKLYLEGLYAGAGLMNQAQGTSGPQYGPGIADVVTMELHDATTPYGTAYTYSNINLLTNGSLAMNTISGSITGSYFVVIKHRNSMETWSATPVSFAGSLVSYDFSISASQAYGNNLKAMSGVFALYAGDVTQDGSLGVLDMTAIDNKSKLFATGYLPEDINGDGSVGALDMLFVDNNSKSFISVKKP